MTPDGPDPDDAFPGHLEESAVESHASLDLDDGEYKRRSGALMVATSAGNPGPLRQAPGLPSQDPRLRLNPGHAPPRV